MTNSSDRFLVKLSQFAEFLRRQGMKVGLGEVQDAARALHLTGFEDRATVKAVLCALFAKGAREQVAFGQCFDQFFVSEEEFRKNEEAHREAERIEEEQRRMAEEELQFNGKPIDLRDDLKDVYARMPQEERDRLKKYAEKYSENLKR